MRGERLTAGAIGVLAGVALAVLVMTQSWFATAESQTVYDGEDRWLCLRQ